MTLLLDTCALVFIVGAPDKLTEATRQAVSDADNTVFVSAVSAGELACATERRRVELDRQWADWWHAEPQAAETTRLFTAAATAHGHEWILSGVKSLVADLGSDLDAVLEPARRHRAGERRGTGRVVGAKHRGR